MNAKIVTEAAHDHYLKHIKLHPTSKAEPLIKAGDAVSAFIAGADWMALQIQERPADYGLMTKEHHDFVAADMVERATRGHVAVFNLAPGKTAEFAGFKFIGWDLAAPGSDCSVETVTMTKAEYDKLKGESDAWQGSSNGWKESRDKMHKRAQAAEGERDKLKADYAELKADYGDVLQDLYDCQALRDKLKVERDDWHAAYDRLVSDIVHGRKPERLVPRGPFPDAQEKCDTASDFYEDRPKAKPSDADDDFRHQLGNIIGFFKRHGLKISIHS